MSATMRHFMGNERRAAIDPTMLAAEQEWWGHFCGARVLLRQIENRRAIIARGREATTIDGYSAPPIAANQNGDGA